MSLNLLLILLSIITTVLLLRSLRLLATDTAWTATAEWRVQSEIDVLLGVEADNERWNIDDLLADADVSLADENTGVVNGLGKAKLVDASLKTALQEILDLKGQNVIELHAGLVENTDANETANQSVTLEKALWVLLVQGQKLTVAIN
jgi:hypothetical protein